MTSTARTAFKRILPALERTRGHEIVAIAGRSPDRVRRFAKRFSVPVTLVEEQPDRLLALDLDAIYVPGPTALHADWTVRALRAGRHVLTEKPLCYTERDARAIVEAQAETGAVLRVNYGYSHSPAFAHVQELVSTGRLGELHSIEVHISFTAGPQHAIRLDRDMGGGALLDLGCYGVDAQTRLTTARLDRVLLAARRPPASGVDTTCAIQLGSSSSDLALTLACSLEQPARQLLVLAGTRGTCVTQSAFSSSIAQRVAVLGDQPSLHSFEPFDQDGALLREMARAIAGDAPSIHRRRLLDRAATLELAYGALG